jgi:hypothetical protein
MASSPIYETESLHDSNNESEYDEEGIDIRQVCGEFFTDAKKNRNIAEVLLEIKRTIDVHNKLLQNLIQVVKDK